MRLVTVLLRFSKKHLTKKGGFDNLTHKLYHTYNKDNLNYAAERGETPNRLEIIGRLRYADSLKELP